MSGSNTHWVVREMVSGRFFHFWDRKTYGEPQFGDLPGAKKYATRSGCIARLRALCKDGYAVIAVRVIQAS